MHSPSGNGFDIRGQTSLCKLDDAHYLSNEKAFWIGFSFAKYVKQKYVDTKLGAPFTVINVFIHSHSFVQVV